MSVMNNQTTLEHYHGNVWLTKPGDYTALPKDGKGINVCVHVKGDFIALDFLRLMPDGIYYHNHTAIGTKDSTAFKAYIEKLTGKENLSETELFDKVCELYETQGSLRAVERELNISRDRIRRILITRKKITSELIKNIDWLYDNGRGKSRAEIAEILKVSESIIERNMPYT